MSDTNCEILAGLAGLYLSHSNRLAHKQCEKLLICMALRINFENSVFCKPDKSLFILRAILTKPTLASKKQAAFMLIVYFVCVTL